MSRRARQRLRRRRHLWQANGARGASLDAQNRGMIANLHNSGDFAGKLGDSLLLPAAGAAAARVLLIGLAAKSAFARKQFRKRCSPRGVPEQNGAVHAAVYLTLEDVADLDVPYAHAWSEVFSVHAYKVRFEDLPKPKRRSLQ